MRHVANVTDIDGPLEDYTVAEARFRYLVSDNAEAYLRVENLFDTEYQSISGYRAPPRGVFVGVRATF